jgi:predicted aminopeptidase
MTIFLRFCALVLVAAAAASCSNVGYYMQSVRGQLDVWSRQRDIQAVVANPETPGPLRAKLQTALRVRDFATSELGLPQNASYRSYANLERPYVVWNVFAAPEFAIEPKQWCFLFVGCVSYRGYFSKEEAEAFGAGVSADGFDVHVGGVPAYSLLGYAPDPVLNTFVNYPAPYFARLVFHELAHQVAFARDDSEFNESFAVAVEQEGLERWLARNGTDEERKTYVLMKQRREDFVNLIETYRDRLNTLFASRLSREIMRVQKAGLYSQMYDDYVKLKASWGGFAGYDRFFAEKPNNALLASVAIYTKKVPAFEALLAREGGDLRRFYAAAKRLSRMNKAERTAELEAALQQGRKASAAAH